MSYAVRKLAEYIRGSDNIVFFGGAGKLKAIVTQNIDGLHQRAGSRHTKQKDVRRNP